MAGAVLLADRANEYDRALRQSQYAATTRRRGTGVGSGSVLLNNGGGVGTGSVMAPGGMMASSMYQSAIGAGGMAMAQTAVLGDSQGSITLGPAPAGPIPDEDLLPDGGVGSGLGESYVDGAGRSKTLLGQQAPDDEDDGLEDGGVLGLLAQIYGGRALHA